MKVPENDIWEFLLKKNKKRISNRKSRKFDVEFHQIDGEKTMWGGKKIVDEPKPAIVPTISDKKPSTKNIMSASSMLALH